jgi:hypothetical protein
MGPLEYQALPFLLDVAHDGVRVFTLLVHSPPASQAGRRVGSAF